MKYKLFYDKKTKSYTVITASLAFAIMPDKKPIALSNSAESLETLVDILICTGLGMANQAHGSYSRN